MHRTKKLRQHLDQSRRTIVFLLFVVMAVAAIVYSLSTRTAFSSPEVVFTDPSHGGLAIVPASCASSVEHWAGECSLTGCVVSVTPPSINAGETSSVYINWNTGAPPNYADDSAVASIAGSIIGLGAVYSSGTLSIAAPSASFDYVYSGGYYDAAGNQLDSFSCSATLTVNNPPTYSLYINQVELYRAPGDAVYAGDLINYRIYMANTGDYQGDFTVLDHVPDGTHLTRQGGGTTNSVGAANSCSTPDAFGGCSSGWPDPQNIWWIQTPNDVGFSGYVDMQVQVDATSGEVCNTPYYRSERLYGNGDVGYPVNTICNPVSSLPLVSQCPDGSPAPSNDLSQCPESSITPPQNVRADCPLPGTYANISWDPVAGATGYNVRVNVGTASCPTAQGWATYTNPDGTNNCYVDNYDGLSCGGSAAAPRACIPTTPGVSYTAWIHASNASGMSPESARVPFLCASESLCSDGTTSQNGVCPGASNCQISASPQSIASGQQAMLSWTTGCSPTYGCTYWGLPVTPRDATLNGVSVEPNDSQTVTPSFGNLSSATYTLTGNYYYGIWPLLFQLDSYSCQTTVSKSDDDDPDTTCADGTTPPDGNLASCPSCTGTPVTGSCIDNADGTQTARTFYGTCGQVDQLCRYAASGYGCFVDTEGAHCEEPPPPLPPDFSVKPQLLHDGETATATWIPKSGSQELSCILTGTNGDQWDDQSLSSTVTHQTSPIHAQTTYVLSCEGAITDEGLAPQTAVVNLIPKFQEPSQ